MSECTGNYYNLKINSPTYRIYNVPNTDSDNATDGRRRRPATGFPNYGCQDRKEVLLRGPFVSKGGIQGKDQDESGTQQMLCWLGLS